MEIVTQYKLESMQETAPSSNKQRRRLKKVKDIPSAIKGLQSLIAEFRESNLPHSYFKTLAYLYQVFISAVKINNEIEQKKGIQFTYIQHVWSLVDKAFSGLYKEISLKLYPQDAEAIKEIFDVHKKEILVQSQAFQANVVTEIYERENSRYFDKDFGSNEWKLEVTKHFIHSLSEKELSEIVAYVNAIDTERKNKILQELKEKKAKKDEALLEKIERKARQRVREIMRDEDNGYTNESYQLKKVEKRIDDIASQIKHKKLDN